jgi:tetratricopeptide (TPR) repeat protein
VKALDLLARAARLSPRDPRGWFITSKMAWAYLVEGRLDEAITAAKKVLNQNPSSAYVLRFLAVGLAKQGRLDDAAVALQRALEIEPQLTLTKLRDRRMFVDEKVWADYSAAIRLAGLPE